MRLLFSSSPVELLAAVLVGLGVAIAIQHETGRTVLAAGGGWLAVVAYRLLQQRARAERRRS